MSSCFWKWFFIQKCQRLESFRSSYLSLYDTKSLYYFVIFYIFFVLVCYYGGVDSYSILGKFFLFLNSGVRLKTLLWIKIEACPGFFFIRGISFCILFYISLSIHRCRSSRYIATSIHISSLRARKIGNYCYRNSWESDS